MPRRLSSLPFSNPLSPSLRVHYLFNSAAPFPFDTYFSFSSNEPFLIAPLCTSNSDQHLLSTSAPSRLSLLRLPFLHPLPSNRTHLPILYFLYLLNLFFS